MVKVLDATAPGYVGSTDTWHLSTEEVQQGCGGQLEEHHLADLSLLGGRDVTSREGFKERCLSFRIHQGGA